jgi:3-oxoacyl-[acyl-carrier protein] reductase
LILKVRAMNVIITGTSRGIGYELVKLASEESGNKLLIISRNEVKIEQLANECKLINPACQVIPLAFDLAQVSNYGELLKAISKEIDSLDILINNAGYLIAKPFAEIHPSENEQMYNVNVLGPMELIRQCLPLLNKSHVAHVVNISSMGGFQGSVKFPGLAGYASSKAAIAGLTECLAEEFKETKIRFNCLALGAVSTEMLAEAFPGYNATTSAKEMAEFIWQFACEGHKMFNGKILPVSNSTP